MEAAENLRSDASVVVVGSNAMQSELMVYYLQVNTELVCSSCSPTDLTEMLQDEACRETLFLVDAQDADLHVLLSDFRSKGPWDGDTLSVAAYNMVPDIETDLKALDKGLQGVFYMYDPPGHIAKGVKAILSGDFWYSRKTLSEYARQQTIRSELRGELNGELTAREKEVLLKMSSGASNQELAEELCISFHTVKTHLYNIYKKLQVNSRFQATLWANRNL